MTVIGITLCCQKGMHHRIMQNFSSLWISFPIDKLYTLNANGTNLPSHPDRNMVEG